MITINLPYRTPPLSANDRMHHQKRGRIVAQVRRDARVLAQATRLPKNCASVDVSLHYAPARDGRRDADNLTPTLKALCDGLVDYGLVADDTPDLMTKHMPVIEPKSTTGHGILWLTITIEEVES